MKTIIIATDMDEDTGLTTVLDLDSEFNDYEDTIAVLVSAMVSIVKYQEREMKVKGDLMLKIHNHILAAYTTDLNITREDLDKGMDDLIKDALDG